MSGDWSGIGIGLGLAAATALVLAQSVTALNKAELQAPVVKRRRTDGADATPKDLTKRVIVPGIRNSGNTCFLNALLQSISASPSLVRHLRYVDELLEAEIIYSGASSPSAFAFSRAFWSAILDLQAKGAEESADAASSSATGLLSTLIHSVMGSSQDRSKCVLDLSSLEKKLRTISKTFSRANEQQDADELLTITLDVLEKESKYAWRSLAPSLRSLGLDSLLQPVSSSNPNEDEPQHDTRPQPPLISDQRHRLKEDQEEFEKRNAGWWARPPTPPKAFIAPGVYQNPAVMASSASPSLSTSSETVSAAYRVPLRNPMEGTLLSFIQCERCGRKSPLRSTPFNVLAIPIPGDKCSILDCLREFVKYESLEGVECSRCAAVSGRNPKQQARKRLMIGRLPTVLCLRLQRNQFDPRIGQMYKDPRQVLLSKVIDVTDACFFSVLAKEEANPQNGASSPWKTDLSSGPDVSANLLLMTLSGQVLPAVRVPKLRKLDDSPAESPDLTPRKRETQLPQAMVLDEDRLTASPDTPRGCQSIFTGAVSEDKNTQFDLVAVVEHLGSAYGGHYIAYRRVDPGDQGMPFWVRCSDETVSVIPEDLVLNHTQCYMCLYEKREKKTCT